VIFVTVGAQMPFDRLVHAVDAWAAASGRSDVFAQIGLSTSPPSHIEWTRFIEPAEFERRMQDARVIVAHAGTGSIIKALQHGRPILVMPRRADLRETRNDHQIATARRFLEQGRVHVAFDERELPERLDDIGRLTTGERLAPVASPELIAAIRSFISGTAA
jgi:UDP-N-acetylglucosamine transferase subunit ALG13